MIDDNEDVIIVRCGPSAPIFEGWRPQDVHWEAIRTEGRANKVVVRGLVSPTHWSRTPSATYPSQQISTRSSLYRALLVSSSRQSLHPMHDPRIRVPRARIK